LSSWYPFVLSSVLIVDRLAITINTAADVHHAEWLPDSRRIAMLVKEGPGRQLLAIAPRDGGVSPDGRELAFIAPAADGFFQMFAMPVAGGTPPRQVTTDPSHKTQPAWSPDGGWIAYTVWNYDVQFWRTLPIKN
jgi:Tol biopolymer transport system component